MKQIKILQAYMATEQLANNNDIPNDIQWDIYQLRKMLYPHVEFYEDRANAIREKYREFASEDGTLTGDKADKFKNEIKELEDMDKEIDTSNKFIIRVNKGTGITALIMEALDEFITFEKA